MVWVTRSRRHEVGSRVFFDLNRNKKSLTLNLKAEAGKEIFKRFVETS